MPGGSPRNLGGPIVSLRKGVAWGIATRRAKAPGPRCSTERRRERIVRVRRVLVSEGNEVIREERSGVGTFHSTEEAGESFPKETLWRKGNVVRWNR